MYKALLVDDELIEREGMKLLIENNFPQISEIHEAENGYKAIDLYVEYEPDIVIMDINMPGMDGLKTIKELIKLKGKSQYIILTSHNRFEHAQEAIRLGVCDFLLKPTNIKDFRIVVNKVIGTLDEQRVDYEEKVMLQSKMDGLVDVLSTDCIYSLIQKNEKQALMHLVQLFGEEFTSGFCFIVKNHDGGNLGSRLLPKLNRFGYFFLSEYIYNLNIFLCLLTESIGKDKKNRVMNYINTILQVSEPLGYTIGIDDICENLEYMDKAYYNVLKSINYGEANGINMVRYSAIEGKDESKSMNIMPFIDELLEIVMKREEVPYQMVLSKFMTTLNRIYGGDYKQIRACVWELMMLLKKMTYDNIGIEVNFNHVLYDQLSYLEDGVQINQFLDKFILSLIETINKSKIENPNRLAIKAYNFIKENFNKNSSLSDLSLHLKLSTFYTCKILKKAYSKSFVDLVSDLRILTAKQLLINTDQSIKEISYSVGFNSQHYFSKIFKKYTNMTPSEYKKKH